MKRRYTNRGFGAGVARSTRTVRPACPTSSWPFLIPLRQEVAMDDCLWSAQCGLLKQKVLGTPQTLTCVGTLTGNFVPDPV